MKPQHPRFIPADYDRLSPEICTRLPRRFKLKLKQQARKHGMTLSAVVREILISYLETWT